MKTRSTRTSTDGGSPFRTLLFYSISMLLSLAIVMTTGTVIFVLMYIGWKVTTAFFLLSLSVLITNIVITAISLRGILRTYPLFTGYLEKRRIVISQPTIISKQLEKGQNTPDTDRNFLTDIENEIVEAIRDNGNTMLQSSIVNSMGKSKATISRAITSLENKGVILRVRKGVTNEIVLSEYKST